MKEVRIYDVKNSFSLGLEMNLDYNQLQAKLIFENKILSIAHENKLFF